MDMFTPDLEKGFARAGSGKSLENFDILAGCTVVIGDDVKACLAQLKPTLALYVGGMGHKTLNFHKMSMIRRGYGDAAERIQELYLAGRKAEAIEEVPEEFLDEQALLGSPDRIRERYQAWADSYITGLTVRTNQPEAIELMADLAKESSGA